MGIRIKNKSDIEKRLIIGGFSKRSFSGHIGVSHPHVNLILNGKRSPSAKIAKKICDGLKAEFDEIFFIEDDNKSYQSA